MVAEYDGPYSARFYDCVIVVVLFTTLVQVGGLTISSFTSLHVQGIVAKPLVETLRLKKNRERNPKIRETQRFQEFENAVKVEIQLFVANLWINNFRQSLFPATSRLSLSPPPGWCPLKPSK